MKKLLLSTIVMVCGFVGGLSAQEAPAAKPLRYKVGDLYQDDDKVGVIFLVDVTGRHGKILSLVDAPNTMTWEEAMTYCSAGTWYLPSKDELIQIFRNKAAVNEGLVKVEGSPLVESWYWTSEEYGKGNKTKKSWFVSMEDSNFYYLDWTEPIYVRAVSAF